MKRLALKRLVWVAAALCAACATAVNLHFDPAKPHHAPEGFRNNYATGVSNSRSAFWTWQWERLRTGVPKPPKNNYQFPLVKPDVARLKANRNDTTATWLGHATVLVQLAGVNILTDPHLTERASPVWFAGPKRVVPPALDFNELPHIDVVVISHNHYDHLDLTTVRRLAQQAGGSPRFFVPLGNKQWFAAEGIADVVEMDWWERQQFKGLELTFTPVQHWSARSFTDRFQTLWGGWHVRTAGTAAPFSFFFAGDTGYSKDFADIAARLGGVDFAMIPIGAYEPRWFMGQQHVDPAESVKIHRDLKAVTSLAMHWGTFELTDEALDEPPARLAVELVKAVVAPERFRVVRHGETIDPRNPQSAASAATPTGSAGLRPIETRN